MCSWGATPSAEATLSREKHTHAKRTRNHTHGRTRARAQVVLPGNLELPRFRRLLIAFGGPGGLEDCLSADKRLVLLIQSSRRTAWVLPKGGWETDEASASDAARRVFFMPFGHKELRWSLCGAGLCVSDRGLKEVWWS